MRKIIVCTILTVLLGISPVFSKGQSDSVDSEKEKDVVLDISDRIVENTDLSITIIDDMGHEVKIPKPVKTIIMLDGKSAHIIRALHAEDMVIGHGSSMTLHKEIFPVITKTVSVGGLHNLDYEKIVELHPDLIIVSYLFTENIDEYLSPIIPVIRLVFDDNDDVTILGSILDKKMEATEYTNWIDSHMNKIKSRISKLSEEEIPDVFMFYGGESGMSPPPPYGTYGRDNLLGNKSIEETGGLSITRDLQGEWVTVDSEWLIEQDPDIVVREYYYNGQDDKSIMNYDAKIENGIVDMMDALINSPVIKTMNASKENNIHMIYGYFVQEYWFLGHCYLAKWFHPELFEDMNPQQMHQEFLTKFLRSDYDLNERGVFSYPPE